MIRHDVITLVSDASSPRGVHEDADPAERTVMCTVRSVSRREVYEAMAQGRKPEVVFELAQAYDYKGEERILFHGAAYDLVRSYETDADSIELICEKAKV